MVKADYFLTEFQNHISQWNMRESFVTVNSLTSHHVKSNVSFSHRATFQMLLSTWVSQTLCMWFQHCPVTKPWVAVSDEPKCSWFLFLSVLCFVMQPPWRTAKAAWCFLGWTGTTTWTLQPSLRATCCSRWDSRAFIINVLLRASFTTSCQL